MIYTVGHKASYDRYLREQGPQCYKRGPRGDYPGGSVWRTVEEAEHHAPEGYAVYGVIADWELDTTPSSRGDWHDLLHDARIVSVPAPDAVGVGSWS